MDEATSPLKDMGLSPEDLSKKANEMGVSLDKITEKLAALGLPGIILIITASASMGATPVIAALTALGGPLGVLGGLGFLGLMTVAGDLVTAFGIETVLSAVYTERRKKESFPTLLKEIETLPLSEALKLKLKKVISKSEPDSSPKVIEIIEE
ncbi:hypothetical protein [Crocosphaera sp. XPORK-15E]|uniref:hypothetical protein n=1 Tax=Crocosphaera sp. XPORK-15E TaxID=3110247 RepID=UPI002B1F5856|nr:hypothetical protein [Crocosphaera sp. XPORK-15E]MEA5536930.1 hypothetical protein [Crocosphaera sp. XPORK-15E]